MLLHVAQGLAVTTLIYPHVAPRHRAMLTQSWSVKLLRILNIKLAVHGASTGERADKRYLVANHISWLDIFVINAACPARFVAKAEIRHWPIAGWLCEAAGTIFIERTRRRDAARINDVIHDALEAGDTVAIFPEGTTTAGDQLLKFHTALLEPAVVNAAHVQPAAIRYIHTNGEPNAAPVFIGETTFGESLGRIIITREQIAEITFAPAIECESMNRREVAQRAECAIAAILNVSPGTAHHRFGSTTDTGAQLPQAHSLQTAETGSLEGS